jgi:beta-fructofuranosidase
VVGAARSTDLVTWEALSPIAGPGEFGQMEVPQLVHLDGRWYLIYCTGQHSAKRLARTGPSGKWHATHYLVSDNLRGPYREIDEGPLVGGPAHDYYAGRIETNLTSQPFFMGFRRFDSAGGFVGGLSNPAPVRVLSDGRLEVDLDALWPGE